ncbi:ATP-dependent DNA helicase RecQ [[Leptolyngbya] sp. PCC 7376]|uniref:RecQ family ATP-dependent DNA helicase n=1 Tax=[Leptolyngbya] sp. PCC 7376 TaxID=111781 RepID=UPI00029EC97E|nr:ATP-dependent DNA helicase RecQ [[Leptolyngbya] sp. PCC 7376]AFY39231.1 ATP-dependent DNA helicase RecQ [[Leptolyngbya] sp. PCC 7376]
MQEWSQIERFFQETWGYQSFRPPQDQIIRSLLSSQDALIVMPTGSGKSICFQLPALLQEGLTLIVSPLIALMENQVLELRQKRLSAAVLHSQVSRQYRHQTLTQFEQNKLRLLYLSPETLLSPQVWEKLIQPTIKINGLIIDEAHCLAQWGDTFRPAYLRLGAVRSALLRHKPKSTKMAIAAFTATADPTTQSEIIRILGLKSPKKFLQNPYRSNLRIRSKTIWTPKGKRQALQEFLVQHKNQSGLIYGRSRKDTEKLAKELKQQGYKTAAYHGGLSPGDRRQREKDWLTNKLQFVVCTNAFGMGINKADVRWILHYHPPSLLAEYVQEIGRAGRDGQPSDVLSLISEPTGLLNPEDKQRRTFFQQKLQRQIQEAQKLSSRLPTQGNLNESSIKNAELSLAILHRIGQLQWLDPFTFQKSAKPSKKAFNLLVQSHTKQAQQINDFWKDKNCRWQYLLNAFGFATHARNFRCGQCDLCQKSKA